MVQDRSGSAVLLAINGRIKEKMEGEMKRIKRWRCHGDDQEGFALLLTSHKLLKRGCGNVDTSGRILASRILDADVKRLLYLLLRLCFRI